MLRFIYKTTNILNSMYYIGMHRTDDLDDGYLGSGRELLKAMSKHGKASFIREILEFADTDSELIALEKAYVTKEVVKDENSYNMTTGGAGRLSFGESCNFSEEGLERLRESGKRYFGENNPFFGKSHTEITRNKLSIIASNRTGKSNPFYGKSHTEEYKRKSSESRKGKDKNNTESIAIRSYKASKGWWCTPFGCFVNSRDAERLTGISRSCIMNRCKSADKIVEKNYQTPEEFWGLSWREIGFYFVPKSTP